jgi:CHAT domain-containing protein/cytochrome c-type biogenesis protein CcmH/NrfG
LGGQNRFKNWRKSLDRGVNEHLSATELAELAVRQRGSPAPRPEEIDPHLAVCPACRDQFEEHVLLHRQLEELKSSEPALHQADCPEPAVWREIAAGLTPPEQALAHVHHASRCDHCGPLLREAVAEVADLNQATTDGEQAQIATLASTQPQWQQHIAERIAGTTRGDPPPAPWWRVWASVPRLAMAGAAVVAAASWIAVHWRPPDSAAQLLARAYSEQRTLEVRFGGAAYAPLRVQRGPEASFADRTPSLLKAEALIASQLPSHPTDPLWLQAKARADLLEGKYDAAVESLRRALELSPDSPELMVDLASAYFQRAQTEDRPQDYGAAFEYLSKVLAKRPDDPVALFNRAIVSEHQFLYHQALDDWEHYLRVDARSEWADEARSHADAVRLKLKDHGSRARPLLSPAEVTGNASASAEVGQRVEQYLDAALQSWLPEAYPETSSAADPHARQALFFLADLTSQQHKDRWLSDLLSGSSAPAFPQAAASLSRAARANQTGDFGVSRQEAVRAEQLFRVSGNEAGVLRAQFEQIYALQVIRQSETCRRQAIATLAESEKYPYRWLQIQLGLEKGVCSSLMGDSGTYGPTARRAMEQAQDSGYASVYLRALYFAAEDQSDTGNRQSSGKLLSAGLERYWSGQSPALRGYALYFHLAYITEDEVNLKVALWREAVALSDSDPDPLVRAIGHQYFANAAVAAGQTRLAEQQYAEAARLYALAPRTGASLASSLENEIGTAQLDAHLGKFDDAFAHLTSVQSQVRTISNNYVAQRFYSTLGELQLRRHREAEAEDALRPALALAERSLASLHSRTERITWSKDASPVYLAMVEAQLLRGRKQEALETYEWYLRAAERAGVGQRPRRSLSNQPGPDSRLASRLPLLSKATVLVYAALPDGLALWTYDNRGVTGQWIAQPTRDLQELAARFSALSADPQSSISALQRDARSLYAALIGPVDHQLAPDRTLVIEADGWLAQVPFEALRDSNGYYLVERVPIVHSLGQDSDALWHNEPPITRDLPALVVGSTASPQAEGLVPLPDVAAEADAVAGYFHTPRVLKGSEATLSAVKQNLPAAAIFHFAGHSLVTPDKEGLMLESGSEQQRGVSLLEADTLRQLNLQNLQVAVLSACSTGSDTGGSRGFHSVTEALLRSGVPHVVASRWAVDSVETRRLVEDFYHNVLFGQPVSEALRQTSRKMLANPRTAHPYYWSAFSAYGRP